MVIPGMKLEIATSEDGGTLQFLTYNYEYNKCLGLGCHQQMVADKYHGIDQSVVMWILIYLESLGIIESGLNAWETGNLDAMRCDDYISSEELIELLCQTRKSLPGYMPMHSVKTQGSQSSANQFGTCVKINYWDPAKHKSHHTLNCHPNNQQLRSDIMTYSTANSKLGEFASQYGYISTQQLNFSITDCHKDFEEGLFKPVARNSALRAETIANIHTGHSSGTA